MKIKHILNGLLAALLLATASCSTDELTKKEGNGPEINTDGTRTIKFKLEGLTLASDKPDTKAGGPGIATDAENVVEDFKLVLRTNVNDPGFDKTVDQEIWYYSKENFDMPDGVNKLQLIQNGKNLTAVINTKLSGTIDAIALVNGFALPKADGSALTLPEYPELIHALLQQPDMNGIVALKEANGVYGANLFDFATTPITTPLPMMGGGQVNTSTSSMPLKIGRAVSRFDLQNRLDKLRILSITPRNATKNIMFKDPVPDYIDRMPPVTVYDGTNYAGPEALAAQTAAPLFYTLPSSLDDAKVQPMTFDVRAMLRAADGTWTEKIYNLRLTREGLQLPIRNNTRYTLSFTDVTDQTLTASIFISDWSNGDNLDGEIGNTGKAPVVTLANPAASNQHVAVLTGTEIIIPITNYTTDIEPGATGVDNVATNLSFDILSSDGNPDHVWLQQAAATPHELDGSTLNWKFELVDSYDTNNKPVLTQIIRIKNKANPAQYTTVRVVVWKPSTNDIYGNDGSTVEKAFQIRTADDLLAFMRTEDNFNNQYISLENDIDLSGYVFETGAIGDSRKELKCTFLGNHHTIRNFKLERTITSVSGIETVGFLPVMFNQVMNLSVEGSIHVTLSGTGSNNQCAIGGLSAAVAGGAIIHCNNHIDITVDNTSEFMTSIGGITGNISGSAIIGCTNTGRIRSNKGYIGGLTGVLMIKSPGGSAQLLGCYNNGPIIADGTSIAGGLIGTIANIENIFIQNCYNSQTIAGSGSGQRGGIAGVVIDQNLAPSSPDQIVVALPVLCFYKQPATPYSMPWGGTAIEASEMQKRSFVDQLNDLSALTAVGGNFTNSMRSSLNGNFIYNATGYPGIRKLTQAEITAITP